jgi:DNA-binding LacI/PurR family transcriptional regulator
MIRLKDVAANAGVSLMTVSKVLRDAPDVSQATKARVRRLADEMGYVPDALAQGLRTRRTRLFGLVVPNLAHPVLEQVAQVIGDRAQELGYDVLVAYTQDNPQREETCIRRLLSRRVDGLFVFPAYRLAPTATVYDELERSRTPTVLLGQRAAFCSQFASVEPDDANASCELTRHLISLGHREIAFLTGPPAAPWAQERFEGYRRALREAGIPSDDRLVFTAGATLEDGRKAVLQMLNESAAATALQTASDLVAIGAAQILCQQGLRIPEDMSVAGFGDYFAAEHFRVPLTTVRQPKMAIAVGAVDTMLHLMRGEKVEPRRLPAELVIRASTGICPDRAAAKGGGRVSTLPKSS